MTISEVLAKAQDSLKALSLLQKTVAGALAGLGALLIAKMAEMPALINSLTAEINNISSHVQSAPVGTIMNMVNRVFPVTELMYFMGAWFAAYAIALIIRIARSFIPTMGG